MMHAFPRTFTLPTQRGERAATAGAAPLIPAAYLRLRREAAGLTRRQVAMALASEAGERSTALDLVMALETPGNTARRPETLDRLSAVFAFDPDVYRQLATDPANHPWICRGCGCSRQDGCYVEGDGCCRPVSAVACSRCLPDDAGHDA